MTNKTIQAFFKLNFVEIKNFWIILPEKEFTFCFLAFFADLPNVHDDLKVPLLKDGHLILTWFKHSNDIYNTIVNGHQKTWWYKTIVENFGGNDRAYSYQYIDKKISSPKVMFLVCILICKKSLEGEWFIYKILARG